MMKLHYPLYPNARLVEYTALHTLSRLFDLEKDLSHINDLISLLTETTSVRYVSSQATAPHGLYPVVLVPRLYAHSQDLH